jgi:hypothetical protein
MKLKKFGFNAEERVEVLLTCSFYAIHLSDAISKAFTLRKEKRGSHGGAHLHSSCSGGRDRETGWPRQKHETLSEKQTKTKRTEGMA